MVLITAELWDAESNLTMIVPVQPASRVVAIASAARLAAPRAGSALPPRSRTGPRTGAARRGADDRDQRVQALEQQRFGLDLRVPERGALFLVAVDPFLSGVDVDERQLFPAVCRSTARVAVT
jgi:hypothetical protein